MRFIKFVVLSLVIFAAAAPAAAHRPLWGEDQGVTEIPDLHTSFAVYRDLTRSGQVLCRGSKPTSSASDTAMFPSCSMSMA